MLCLHGVDPKPSYEAPHRLAWKAGSWLAGEIWLKSSGLTSRLKLAFYDFLQVQGAVGMCGTKTAIHLMNNTVYCLRLNVGYLYYWSH